MQVRAGFEVLPRELTYRVFTGDDPAAGAEASVTVPGLAEWFVLSFQATLVTDATVANRDPVLTVDDGTTTIWRLPSGVNHTASVTRAYVYEDGLGDDVDSTTALVRTNFVPTFPLLPGYRIRTVTTNLQAGDNWSAPTLYVAEVSARGAAGAAELAREVLRELVRRTHLEDVAGPDPLATLLGRMFGSSVYR